MKTKHGVLYTKQNEITSRGFYIRSGMKIKHEILYVKQNESKACTYICIYTVHITSKFQIVTI